MSHISIAEKVFTALTEKSKDGKLPVNIRPLSTIGTVQDDPFDQWFGEILQDSLPEFEVTHSGPLTTPDIIVRDRKSREVIGIEVKKIDANEKGKDSRGLTLDYNSCIPCGQMLIKIGGKESRIKTFYYFGLLSYDKKYLVSSCLMDGDFLNYDFDLHIQGKYLNTSQYGHGPYGEGSVRGRAMYNYPNPMNVELITFHKKHSFIIKDEFSYQMDKSTLYEASQIERKDIKSNIIRYIQYTHEETSDNDLIKNIFEACKKRKPIKRKAYLTEISEAPAKYTPSNKSGI
ncbi:MAG: hypothetical protein HAW67_00640 [Endozoicomonadaceae bacterium]|nr:hypothetical protein [Endozoicomonadaceae bacterium]